MVIVAVMSSELTTPCFMLAMFLLTALFFYCVVIFRVPMTVFNIFLTYL